MTGILLGVSAQLCKSRFTIQAMKGALALLLIAFALSVLSHYVGSDSLVGRWIEQSRLPTGVDERETLTRHGYLRVLGFTGVLLDVGVER